MSKIPNFDREQLRRNAPGQPLRNPDMYFVMLMRAISSTKYGTEDKLRSLLLKRRINPDADTTVREARRVWRQLHRQFETYDRTWLVIERILDTAGWELIFLKDAARYWIRDTRETDPVDRLDELLNLLEEAKGFKDYKVRIRKTFGLINDWGR